MVCIHVENSLTEQPPPPPASGALPRYGHGCRQENQGQEQECDNGSVSMQVTFSAFIHLFIWITHIDRAGNVHINNDRAVTFRLA